MSDAGITTPPAAPTAPATPTAPVAPAAPTAPVEKLFTQAEVDSILGDRLNRERAKFADYDDVKKVAASRDADIEAARKEAETSTSSKFHSKLVNSRVKSIAESMKFHDPEDAKAVIDPAKLPIKDDEVDDEAVKAALKDLVKSKPYLVQSDDSKTTPKIRPKLPEGDKKATDGKTSAIDALRELAAQRHGK